MQSYSNRRDFLKRAGTGVAAVVAGAAGLTTSGCGPTATSDALSVGAIVAVMYVVYHTIDDIVVVIGNTAGSLGRAVGSIFKGNDKKSSKSYNNLNGHGDVNVDVYGNADDEKRIDTLVQEATNCLSHYVVGTGGESRKALIAIPIEAMQRAIEQKTHKYGLNDQSFAQVQEEITDILGGSKEHYVPGDNTFQWLLNYAARGNGVFAEVTKSHPKDAKKPNLDISLLI